MRPCRLTEGAVIRRARHKDDPVTLQPTFARIPRLAGAALVLFLATAPGAMAACGVEDVSESPDLRNCDLSGRNLSNLNMRDTDLSGANLSGANLSDTNLFGANLNNTNLTGANLARVRWIDGSRCSPRSTDGACLRWSCADGGGTCQ